jgi:hypothetical protein
MAVKVRCPTCEKVLSAPDAARGKAVKCPGCETKVKVPVGGSSSSDSGKSLARKSSAKAPAKKVVDNPDSDEFLAALDLDNVVDSSQAMCPKCGAALPEDATECPQCGVDPSTGQLTASAKKKRSMKGPDPAAFYGEAWRDSWAFVKENSRVAVRTFFYVVLFSFLYGFCGGMAGNRSFTMPPRVFWAILATATFLVIPGWIWFLTIETIRTTVAKRKLSLGKVNFDIFLCMALGIKTVLWIVVFSLFLPIPFAFLMFPLAMIHMAMPVTKRGWLNFLMLSTFFRNIAPALYFWVIAIVTYLPGAIVYGLTVFFFRSTLLELLQVQDIEKLKMTGQMWVAVGVTAFVVLAVQFVNSFLILFNARVIGLLAYYFQNSLDLTTFVAEKTYVSKQVKLDKFGVPIKTKGQKAGEIALVVAVFVVVAAAGYFIYYSVTKKG